MQKSLDNQSVAISVVMATYNGERFLREQLDSIIDQHYPASEIIACDDRSTDNTPYILEEYATRVEKVKFSVNSIRLGVVENFKKAASHADKSHYIALADQDDIWLPEKLSSSLDTLREIEDISLPAMVYGDPIVVDSAGQIISSSFWRILEADGYRHSLETILYGNPVQGCTTLMNPALAKYIDTIPSDIKGHDAWLALCAYAFGKVKILEKPLIKYRQHDNNVTFSTSFKQKSRLGKMVEELFGQTDGQSSLFLPQFILVQRFYDAFHAEISSEKKLVIENFLRLRDKSYLRKKLAFRKAMCSNILR